MNPHSEESGWQQHFPTYHFKERDIALEEYTFATKTLEAEERVFLNAANIAIVVGAALGSLALGSFEKLTKAFAAVIPELVTLTLILVFTWGYTCILLRYFADRQKAIVFAARKVIVLRRMLGMNYGNLQLVLPNWRVEGADNPFAVKLFPGWNTYVVYPCYTIVGISTAVFFFVAASMCMRLQTAGKLAASPLIPFLVVAAILWFAVLCWIYRNALLDTHERPVLIFAQLLAKTLRLKLLPNTEYIIYRATLARFELQRLGIDLAVVKRVLVHIEDKEFYSHPGISCRGLGRLALSLLGRRRRSGGSTITQQLVRTLFIEDQTKLFRRKTVEILLALWFNRVLTKPDQLGVYLASVRFESGVFGLTAAMKHFWGTIKKTVTPAEAFFLIERVSNVRSKLLVEKVDQTLRGAVAAGLLCNDDARQVVALYADAINDKKIWEEGNQALARLQTAWQHS